jgi:two-component system sensor histidine kinase KdpD
MTRLESGGLTVKKEWQPVQEVIGSALHRLDRRLSGRRVTTHIPDDLPLASFDGVLIEQVLMNLLDNAVEYTPSGSAIDISARRIDGAIEIEVSDSGPGLPTGTEKWVFQKFFRAGRSTSNRRGMGLGLAICRGIVEAHGGTIDARNRADAGGSGAIFRLTLPAGATPPPTVVDPGAAADHLTHA